VEIFYVVFFFSFFQIKKIEILDNQKISKQEIQNAIETQIKKKVIFWETKSIFLQNFKEINKLLLNKFPVIEKTIFKRNFPDKIIVKIIERQAMGKYCEGNAEEKPLISHGASGGQLNSEQCYSFDKNGVIFELVENQEFSTSSMVEENNLVVKQDKSQNPVILGQKVFSKEILDLILKIQNKIEKDLKIGINEFVVETGKITAKTFEGWEIYFQTERVKTKTSFLFFRASAENTKYFPLEGINLCLTKLQLLLEKAIPIEKRKNLEYIDLRFTKAYYKYK